MVKCEKFTETDAPSVCLSETELAGDALIKFYMALGWNGQDSLDPCKVRTTSEVFYGLLGVMLDKCPDRVSVGMSMVNSGPGVDADVPPGMVRLLEGWTFQEQDERGGATDGTSQT